MSHSHLRVHIVGRMALTSASPPPEEGKADEFHVERERKKEKQEKKTDKTIAGPK